MIKAIKCKETQKIYEMGMSRKLPKEIQQQAYRKLLMLGNAVSIDDLRLPPSNHLEKLSGNLAGLYSIRINLQWRLVFQWEENQSFEVQIVDYH